MQFSVFWNFKFVWSNTLMSNINIRNDCKKLSLSNFWKIALSDLFLIEYYRTPNISGEVSTEKKRHHPWFCKKKSTTTVIIKFIASGRIKIQDQSQAKLVFLSWLLAEAQCFTYFIEGRSQSRHKNGVSLWRKCFTKVYGL